MTSRSLTWFLCLMLTLATHSMADPSTPEEEKRPRTGLVWDARFADHDTGEGHPENAERLKAIDTELRNADIRNRLAIIAPRKIEEKWILLAHSADYLEIVKQAHRSGAEILPTGDTPFSPKSLETAKLAAGGVLEACDQVMAGNLQNAFSASRPPGHHATRSRGMGFCVFGHVAIAAKYLQEKHGLERILVVDWDVHHGNGTYDILKADPHVFQFQIHQRGIYPGTGSADEKGEGKAVGNTLHVPLPAGAGRREFLRAFEQQLVPAMNKFRPQFILISAGFDAHRDDPLGGLMLTGEDYGDLTRILKKIADRHAEGRIVSVLEGGYHLKALSESVRHHVTALME